MDREGNLGKQHPSNNRKYIGGILTTQVKDVHEFFRQMCGTRKYNS
jgi:hypothetical protein